MRRNVTEASPLKLWSVKAKWAYTEGKTCPTCGVAITNKSMHCRKHRVQRQPKKHKTHSHKGRPTFSHNSMLFTGELTHLWLKQALGVHKASICAKWGTGCTTCSVAPATFPAWCDGPQNWRVCACCTWLCPCRGRGEWWMHANTNGHH